MTTEEKNAAPKETQKSGDQKPGEMNPSTKIQDPSDADKNAAKKDVPGEAPREQKI